MRQVDIFKGSSRFAHFVFLEDNARLLFDRLAQEHFLQGFTSEQFAARAAFYLGELNALHPFREGNGRTQRVFLSMIAQAAGYQLLWSNVDATRMVEASVLSLFRADNSELERILLDIIAPL